MELALSLGDQSRSPKKMKELGFCMGLGSSNQIQDHHHKKFEEKNDDDKKSSSSSDLPPLQLDLVPFSPPPHQSLPPPLSQRPFPWLSRICNIHFSLYFFLFWILSSFCVCYLCYIIVQKE